ncbi:enamine deaminase RidA [Bordetella genomosp. 8]|uniref:Enamine deaminase RidA n=1 Tax=Bordetella genomosp. 8 TaxID=1416806 RepID=A0A1W6YUF8_9BORD|nr:RidA family protein [Bordetella genomosp. 8]ARP84732.1 enamine deaminase RidA [Bordetella genomosp. 8]
MQILQPPDWLPPRGYSNGVMTEMRPGSRLVFIGGQIGWNGAQQFETDDFADQTRQALMNVVAVLAEAKGEPRHITRLTWYVTDRAEYVASYPRIGAHYREIIGRHFPAMTAVQVAALVEPRAKVEIEATAVIPG